MSLSFTFQRTGGIPITISRGADQSSDFGKIIQNSASRLAGDSSFLGYAQGPIIIEGVLILKLVSKAEADAFRTWLVNDLQFINEFKITPPASTDIGGTPGTALLKCHWNGEFNTRNYVKSRGAGNKFDIEIPYYSLDLVGAGSGVGVEE